MATEAQRLETVIGVAELFRNGIINIPKLTEGCVACPNFGRRWACPPFDFDTESLWRKYKTLRVISVKIIPDKSSREKIYATDEYESFSGTLLEPYKIKLNRELTELERSIPGSCTISLGSCDGCPQPCPKTQGKPCRRADMRPTLEALGADVSRIAEEYLNTKLLWMKNGIPPEYYMLIGGILFN